MMHWVDWLIVIVPLLGILGVAIYSRKYVKGVVDYLAAGRVASRYVLTVGDMTSGLGIISLVALSEAAYKTGFAVNFWGVIATPIMLFVSLSGYCIYRFRETKALSNGQFLEIRYSRRFRVLASFIRIISEMLTNAIGPAVAANFFIYYLGLPHVVTICGVTIPTFAFIVGTVLVLALIIILPGGRISLLITDCLQGMVCYPVFVMIAIFIMLKFSWNDEIIPVMTNRVAGENFFNPFDISELDDFNLFALFVIIAGGIYNRASFAGNDNTSAGINPHEQKMASVLGAWRGGFSGIMCVLIAIAVITVMNHANHATEAHEIRQDLSHKVAAKVIQSDDVKEAVNNSIASVPVLKQKVGQDAPLSHDSNLDTIYHDTVKQTLGEGPQNNLMFQKFRALYNQMMMPMALRKILPVGLLGVFCLLAVLLMVTTDDSRIFNASSAIIQDLVVPFRNEPLAPKQHMLYVKWCSVFVAVFFFCGSLFFSQLDYINMYLTIMVSIWLGGAGPVMIFGLYTRFGNTVGAYCALIFGSGSAIAAVFLQRNWADFFYPLFVKLGWAESIGAFLAVASSPFNPYVEWKMNAFKCPINSYEFYLIAMLIGTAAYIAGSLITYRKPFNLERMLHRGKYNVDGVKDIHSKWTWKNLFSKIIGITPDYTRGDKIIVWSIFLYTFVYGLGICFAGVLIWNYFYTWPQEWWSKYYYIIYFVVHPTIGVITTIWFFCGGVVDIRKLFKALAKRVDNPLDNGTVQNHVSVADIPLLGQDDDEDS